MVFSRPAAGCGNAACGASVFASGLAIREAIAAGVFADIVQYRLRAATPQPIAAPNPRSKALKTHGEQGRAATVCIGRFEKTSNRFSFVRVALEGAACGHDEYVRTGPRNHRIAHWREDDWLFPPGLRHRRRAPRCRLPA